MSRDSGCRAPARQRVGTAVTSTASLASRGRLLGGEDGRLLRRERRVDRAAGLADELAGGRLLVGGHVAQRRVELGERRVLAGVGGARGLQARGVAGGGDRGERRLDGRSDGLLGDRGRVRHEYTEFSARAISRRSGRRR